MNLEISPDDSVTGCPHRFRRDDGTKIRAVNDMFCHGTCVAEIVLSPTRAHFAKFMFCDRQLRRNTRRNMCGQGVISCRANARTGELLKFVVHWKNEISQELPHPRVHSRQGQVWVLLERVRVLPWVRNGRFLPRLSVSLELRLISLD